MNSRNIRASRNGRNAERIIEALTGVKVNQRAIIDYPHPAPFILSYPIGEVKSIEKERREDGGFSRITIEKRQVQELKKRKLYLALIHHERKEIAIIPPTTLNGCRQISWKKLWNSAVEILSIK